MAIDVGSDCIDRPTDLASGYTNIDKNNPANASGTITNVCIWAAVNLANCEVAIFQEVAADTFTTRSNVAIGAVTAGSAQNFAVSLAIVTGDYIGIYFSAGLIEKTTAGENRWYKSGDHIPCTSVLFSVSGAAQLSVYGTSAPAGWTGKISGVTNPAKIMGVAVGSIAKVKGVA